MNRSEGQWGPSLSYHTSSEKQFGKNHEIQAHDDQGKEIGNLTWNPEHGHIKYVHVNKEHRGKEIASHMWDLANQQAAEHGGSTPKHDIKNMTNAGHRFADKVSGLGWWKS
jgi:ribosomal protein S18 acetylase RimI-like enzyme